MNTPLDDPRDEPQEPCEICGEVPYHTPAWPFYGCACERQAERERHARWVEEYGDEVDRDIEVWARVFPPEVTP